MQYLMKSVLNKIIIISGDLELPTKELITNKWSRLGSRTDL